MAAGFPVKADYATGDVLSAVNMNDLSATLNYIDPTGVTNGHVLTRDSTAAGGLEWAAAGGGGGGKLVQLVRATDATNRSTTSTSAVDASISVSITPTSASNNIMLIWAFYGYIDGVGKQQRFQITDSSNVVLSGAENAEVYTNGGAIGTMSTLIGFVNAGSTSARTYKGRFYCGASGATLTVQNSLTTGQLYAIEVAP
jgi:hypothetical protein